MRVLPRKRANSGFTLAEVAVTVAIVAITITVSLQALEGAKMTSAQTRNMKLARELGLELMGQIESGLFWEDLETGRGGSFAEQGYPDFYYEFTLGDETFYSDEDYEEGAFDNWAYRRERDREADDYDEDAEEENQPYEEVSIKVTFPRMREEFTGEVILERWIPWEQVYGPDEEGETEDINGGSGDDASAG